MSQGERVPISLASAYAAELVNLLADTCHDIAIAGSIRRGVPEVADIEIVAMPYVEQRADGGLWGSEVETDLLDERLRTLRHRGDLGLRQVALHRKDGTVEYGVRDGKHYKALDFGMPVDLFIVRDPDQWGVIFTIRTGPADWSHRLVTDCQRYLRRVEGGYLYRSGQRWPCPTELDFFEGIGQPWVAPAERSAGRVAIQAHAGIPA